MEKKNTINPENTDATVVKNNPAGQAPKTAAAQTAAKTEESEPALWKSVLVGGVPGILIGAGGMAAGTMAYGHAQEEEGTDEQHDSHIGGGSATVVDAEIHEAHSVSDDMSFSEAFAAARAEVGPGGAFVWHGQVYGTYRADDPEWQQMSAEDRAEHSEAILSQVHATPYTPGDNEPVIVENNDDVRDDDVLITEDGDDTGEVDVHIVGVEQVELEDGSEVAVGYGEVDGSEALFVDTTGDGEVDTVLIDIDGDGDVGLDEVFDAEGSGLMMDQLVAEAEASSVETLDDQLYADMPDYTNDADMSSLV